MKTLLYPILFISVVGYGQIDSLSKQVEFDSVELIKTQLRIDSLKLELDSLRFESEKIQIIIDKLKEENIQLKKLMEIYIEQTNSKQKQSSKKRND